MKVTSPIANDTPVARILIVDRDPEVTVALAARLRGLGFATDISHSSHNAMLLALRQRPDLIILDVDMPVFTGLEFHECLQYAGRCRDIPVVYLSASDSSTSRLVALRQGARAFLTKPFETRELLDVIDRILEPAAA